MKDRRFIGLIVLGIVLFLGFIKSIGKRPINPSSQVGIAIVIIYGGLALLYFLPSIIGRKKKNASAIFILNLFLGWTILGWVGALVWACTKD